MRRRFRLTGTRSSRSCDSTVSIRMRPWSSSDRPTTPSSRTPTSRTRSARPATGQSRDVGRLTDAVHEVGAVAVWDLAHSVGNVPLSLHDWAVDAAAWCTYKYLNAGPGAIAKAFVQERHLREQDR